MTRVLVTGATGFCGRRLVPALSCVGYRVRAAVRRPVDFPSDMESVRADLAEPVEWAPLLDGVEVVVHLAAITAGEQFADADYDRVNHRGTEAIANAAKIGGVRHFVFVSSVSAQSGPAADRPLSEADNPRPSNAYGRSKLAAERAVQVSGVPFTILRPVMVYDKPRGYLARLARLAATPFPLPFGAFHNRRSFLGLENFASAVLFVLRSPATMGETFLVADPEPVTLPEILTAFRRGLGRRPMMFPFPAAPLRRLMGGSGTELIAKPSKLMNAGWLPVTDTKSLLAAAVRLPAG